MAPCSADRQARESAAAQAPARLRRRSRSAAGSARPALPVAPPPPRSAPAARATRRRPSQPHSQRCRSAVVDGLLLTARGRARPGRTWTGGTATGVRLMAGRCRRRAALDRRQHALPELGRGRQTRLRLVQRADDPFRLGQAPIARGTPSPVRPRRVRVAARRAHPRGRLPRPRPRRDNPSVGCALCGGGRARLFGQRTSQPGKRRVQAGFHRANGDRQPLRDLGQRVAMEIDQLDRLALQSG